MNITPSQSRMHNGVHDFRATQVCCLDLSGLKNKAAVLAALGTGLGLPAHYGGNFDALADCLMDGDWARADSITIVLSGSANAARGLKADWQTLIEVFEESCAWWAERGKAFQVILC